MAESVFGTGDCDACGATDVPIGWMADNDYSLCFACLPTEHERLREQQQAVLNAVNLYGDETLHQALDDIGAWPREGADDA